MSADELARMREEAPAARAHATAEFRLGYSLTSDTPHAPTFRRDAWRLMAGLTPVRTYFYCITD